MVRIFSSRRAGGGETKSRAGVLLHETLLNLGSPATKKNIIVVEKKLNTHIIFITKIKNKNHNFKSLEGNQR